jgi:nucleoside-triphosphatase THEP1
MSLKNRVEKVEEAAGGFNIKVFLIDNDGSIEYNGKKITKAEHEALSEGATVINVIEPDKTNNPYVE